MKIALHDRHGKVCAYALVDDADAALLTGYSWHFTGRYAQAYVRGTGRAERRYVSMHRLLLGLTPGDGLEGDHINGDKLDNRRSNLRVATRALNGQNRTDSHGYSRHRGVSWHRRSRCWVAQVRLDGKLHNLGSFDREEDAAEAAASFRRERMPFSPEAAAA